MKQKKLGIACIVVSFLTIALLSSKSLLVSTAYDYARALLVPSTFDRTHFILGYPALAPRTLIRTHAPVSVPILPDGSIRGAFFPPDDNVRDILISLIGQEKERISIAAYTFTDRIIAQSLCDAKERGISIELVTDLTGLSDRYNKIIELSKHAIEIFVYNPKQEKQMRHGLMHNKFAIFSKNIADKSLIWTGSCNFTKSGNQLNQENVVILDDQLFVDKFTAQFERLKKRSSVYIFQQQPSVIRMDEGKIP